MFVIEDLFFIFLRCRFQDEGQYKKQTIYWVSVVSFTSSSFGDIHCIEYCSVIEHHLYGGSWN